MNTTINPPTNDIVKTSISPSRKVKDVLDNHLRIPKPILKWVGGKTQILNNVPEFPVEMDNYVEPFWAAGVLTL
jgi:DNA adenine methylase